MTSVPLRRDEPPNGFDAGRNVSRYPTSLRILHWTRAALVLGMLGVGWSMTRLGDAVPIKYGTLYPLHKSFGLLVLGLVAIQIVIRLSTNLPRSAGVIAAWEDLLSKFVHAAMYLLLIAVPLMGYAMSSSYSHSDGVTFFGTPIAEILPKNDARFAVFQWMHRTMAYTLLAIIGLHVAGVVKHRYFDKRPGSDILPRML